MRGDTACMQAIISITIIIIIINTSITYITTIIISSSINYQYSY